MTNINLLNSKLRLLCILHTSPPIHGASTIGDTILYSPKVNQKLICKFLQMNGASELKDIGSVSISKLIRSIMLFWHICFYLCTFRPQLIYYTASTSGPAIYRDLLFSKLWKVYARCFKCEIYFHYHARGLSIFQSKSSLNRFLVAYLLRDVNVILLSQRLQADFEDIPTIRGFHYLNNGVDDTLHGVDFSKFLNKKYSCNGEINILFLSNMIKEKGFYDILELANKCQNYNRKFHFAGRWETEADKLEFNNFVIENNLLDKVIYHGFVSGVSKKRLLKITDLMVFPTKYSKEAFPLVLLEALSYGIPIVSTRIGGIPDIVSKDTGLLVDNDLTLEEAINQACKEYMRIEVSIACRERFIQNYRAADFEDNFIKILNS